jgi:aminotransferase
VSLTIGQPDFPTPEHIKNAAKAAINDNKTYYTPNAGLPELRKAVSGYYHKKYGLYYDPDNEIIVTNGASEAIDTALRTILEEGSEVILPGPVYPAYEPIIRLCGAFPVYVDTTLNNFKINASMIKEKITENTRCIILPYPSNPTGCILDNEDIKELADLLADRDIFILSDEIYSELVYNGEHMSIASYPKMKEKTIVVNGLSKSHSMTGWRIGFTLAPEYVTKHMLKVHQYNATCASSISQYAAVEALVNGFEDSMCMREEYENRRNYTFNRLLSMGLDVVKPEGAFYIFPSIKKFNMKSFDFAYNLLDKAKVAVVPGDAFSIYGEGYIRISYACSMELLKEGLNRIESFIKTL